MPGFWEFIILVVVLVVVLGARYLPALGEFIGRTIVKARHASQSRDDIEGKVEAKRAEPGSTTKKKPL